MSLSSHILDLTAVANSSLSAETSGLKDDDYTPAVSTRNRISSVGLKNGEEGGRHFIKKQW